MTLRPAAVFSDHMVLQRERPIPLWGTAAPGAQVACRLEPAVAAASGQADGAGSWRITLPALPAGGPYTLILTAGSQTVCLDDVWLGEVWLAGGQSNMELPLANSRDGQAVLARCADPRLHFYETPKVTTPEAAQAAPSGWQKVTPDTAANLSAVAYYAAAALARALDVHVGILECFWGGTYAHCWMPRRLLETFPEGQARIRWYDARVGDKTDAQFEAECAAYQASVDDWNRRIAARRAADPDVSWTVLNADCELCRMQELTGADTVIFCPGAVQTGPFVEEIDFTGRHTTSDEELLAMTQLAHDRGMRVFWKPAVNCLDGTWRARISFFDHDVPCETKWSGWFASYQAFQLHFAALAQQAGADMLILGCEMTQAERREAEWRRLIAAVRSVYAGAVSYNCDKYGEEHVSWWDALDVIASSGYYPIGQIDQNLDRIEPVVQHFQKPFFFVEAGCMQIAGSAAVPNNWELQGAPDPEEQARWYNALLTACQARPWFGGTAFWDWPLPAHAAADRYAFIQGPALDRIRAFYCAGK